MILLSIPLSVFFLCPGFASSCILPAVIVVCGAVMCALLVSLPLLFFACLAILLYLPALVVRKLTRTAYAASMFGAESRTKVNEPRRLESHAQAIYAK